MLFLSAAPESTVSSLETISTLSCTCPGGKAISKFHSMAQKQPQSQLSLGETRLFSAGQAVSLTCWGWLDQSFSPLWQKGREGKAIDRTETLWGLLEGGVERKDSECNLTTT